jgi:hypothetical protein
MAGANLDRIELAKKRLRNILRSHIVATSRTLENKISDAGPTNQRIDPHILTIARNQLEYQKEVLVRRERGVPWYYLAGTADAILSPRLAELQDIHQQTTDKHFTLRLGQALEIAVSKALQGQSAFQSVGHFKDLDKHDDSTLYSKEEPPSFISGRMSEGKLDFVLFTENAGVAGVEVKNIREWFYSDRDEVSELLEKCCALDAVPVLIVRRYAYEAFSVLSDCGVIVHQMYNQRYANADAALAEKVKDKRMLGYHDVRVGNVPDERLLRFVRVNLPALIEGARPKFEENRELLEEYASGRIGHGEFVARVRGREYEAAY